VEESRALARGCGGLSLRRRSWMLRATHPDQFARREPGGEDQIFDERFARLNSTSSAEPEPLPTQVDRDFFATEGTSDTRRQRPELGRGRAVHVETCVCKHGMRC